MRQATALVVAITLLVTSDAVAQKKKTDAAAAKRSSAAGKAAAGRKDWESAYQYYKQAVEQSPTNIEYRYQLALVYEKLKKPANAWYQLRQAVRGKGRHPKSTQRFLFYWSVLSERGAFDVGKTVEEVHKILGKPDKSVKKENLQRSIYGFMSVNFVDGKAYSIINLRGFSDDGFDMVDMPNLIPSSKEWRLKLRRMSTHRVDVIYVHKQDTKKVKTRLVVLRFIDGMKRKPVMADEIKSLKTGLQKSTANLQWTSTKTKEKEAEFSYQIPAEGQRPAMHELSKVLFGRKDIHRVSIIRRGAMFPPSDARRYASQLSNVTLVSASRKRVKAKTGR